ncbi:MAG: ABC transporter substrate-binding protein [Deltaproteobacteria bacterium]|nr:ABC transporter substrate-binding protein [Deltaproteobacteria bacterium]
MSGKSVTAKYTKFGGRYFFSYVRALRGLRGAIGFFILTSVFSTLSMSGRALGQTKIRAAFGTPSLSQVVFPLGVQSGMFSRHGLSVEPIYVAGRSINLLISGDVQFGFSGGPQTVLARLSGADLMTIAGLNRPGQMVAAHPSIKSPQDLIGKKVGIGIFGTTADYGMRLALRKFNLRANRDVTFVSVGDVPGRIAAVTSGTVQAVILSSYDKHFLEQHNLRMLTDTDDIDFMASGIMVTESYARANRETVMRLLRGVVDTIRLIKTEPKRTTELLGKIYRETDQAFLARRYQTLLGIYPDYPIVSPGAIQSIIDLLKEDGRIKDSPPAQSYLDMNYLRAVEKERVGK